MPALDVYHDTAVNALIADGWKITHDPLTISYGGKDLYVDLGAERVTIAAEKAGQKIAVEVKSFVSPSPLHDLEQAVGQYDIYNTILSATEPDRQIYLAVPHRIYENVLMDKLGQLLINSLKLRLITFDEEKERIIKWIT